MKKLVLVLGFALASGLALAESEPAQQTPPPGSPGGAHPSWHDEIGLTDAQRQEMRRIQDAGGTRAEINAVLTPEQRTKIQELKRESKGGGPGPNTLKADLGLSDEQVAQMKKIREEGGSRQDMAKVLTPEQKEKFDQMKQRPRGPHRVSAPPPAIPPTGEEPPGWGLKKSE